jgi:hypothetical protein
MRGHRWNARVSSEGGHGTPPRHVAFFASCRMGDSTVDAKSTLHVQVLVELRGKKVWQTASGRWRDTLATLWQHCKATTISGSATSSELSSCLHLSADSLQLLDPHFGVQSLLPSCLFSLEGLCCDHSCVQPPLSCLQSRLAPRDAHSLLCKIALYVSLQPMMTREYLLIDLIKIPSIR